MQIIIPIRLTMAHGIRGGMETQAQSLAEGLLARGHKPVMLTTPHPQGISEGYEGSVPVKYIAPGSWRRYRTEWWDASYHTLEQMHRQQPVDILLSQSAGGLGYIPRAVAELRIPSAVIIHGSITGELRNRLRDLRSLRGIYRLIRHMKRLPQLLLLWKKAAPMVQRWIVVNHETAHEWQRELTIPSERIHVILNGIDTTSFRPDPQARQRIRQHYDIPPDAPLLIAAGRIEYEKGVHLAITAVQTLLPHFPDIRLLIAGDGIYHSQLQRLAQALPAHTVLLPGYVPNTTLPSLLAAADIFLMPTLRDEGLPMSTIEALASGLPVITSRTAGLLNVIDEGESGLFVPMNDTDALVQAIAHILNNPTQRHHMAQQARQKAVDHFSREHMIQATEHLLQDIVASVEKKSRKCG